jgi:hypothetical protein
MKSAQRHSSISDPKPSIARNYGPVALLCILLTACAPAFADVHYTTQMHWNGDVIFEAWISGSNGRFNIKRSSDPSFPPGAVIFTRDGGNTAFLFSSESSDCLKMTSDQLVDFKRNQIQKIHITADTLKVEHLAEEDGPEMLSLKTHHSKVRISVMMHVPNGSSALDYVVAVDQDFWTAPDVHEQAPNLVVFTNSTMGIALLDDAVAAELAKLPGFPLKRLLVQTTSLQGQFSDTAQTSVEVTDFDTAVVDKTQLDLPKSCSDAQ